MVEVLVAGAGPAGSVAALVLARAGVRVLVVDRAQFPRHKLCGDTLNPGALAQLRRLAIAGPVEAAGVPLTGMAVTAPWGSAVEADYPRGVTGLAVSRRDLDALLLDAARRAGARVELGVRVRGALVDEGAGARRVRGVVLDAGHGPLRLPARVTIAADGRRSTLAFGLDLARHPPRSRRWAVGAYFEGVSGMGPRGEMHVRPGHYVGLSPLPGGVVNACVVTPRRHGFGNPLGLLLGVLADDPRLQDRFAAARPVTEVACVGPLAVEARSAGLPGLLLAGDAAGFVGPLTGDGLRFALHGGVLAAETALEMLEAADDLHGHLRLARRRRHAFGAKRRLNAVLRAVVSTPAVVRAGALGAALFPGAVRALVRAAGDVRLATEPAG